MAILIIDDDPGIRRAHTRILETAGFAVTAVENGVAAFEELYGDQVYQAILCDLDMPVLDGTAFFEQLEERLPEMASRVVFLTGLLDARNSERFAKETGQPCLEKPAAPEQLLACINQVSARNSGSWSTPLA